MCGPETTDRPRGGALAALTSKEFSADLAFHTPGSPGDANATHARLTPDAGHALDDELYVTIHSSGDLTKSAAECGLFRRFTLSRGSDTFIELPLDAPLSLQVGDQGIIGRRVSLHSRSELVAEGIVGFNFEQKASL